MNRQVPHNLDNIIAALSDPRPGKSRYADGQQHPPHPCRPAAYEHARATPRLISKTRFGATTRPEPSTPLPARQRASNDSLRQRLEIANPRNRELSVKNPRPRRQLTCVFGQLRADIGRHPMLFGFSSRGRRALIVRPSWPISSADYSEVAS